jgi:hypothetical protein
MDSAHSSPTGRAATISTPEGEQEIHMDDKEKRVEVDPDSYDPNDPGSSKAGRGGIVSPGGQQPRPREDPRDDSGIPHPDQQD